MAGCCEDTQAEAGLASLQNAVVLLRRSEIRDLGRGVDGSAWWGMLAVVARVGRRRFATLSVGPVIRASCGLGDKAAVATADLPGGPVRAGLGKPVASLVA